MEGEDPLDVDDVPEMDKRILRKIFGKDYGTSQHTKEQLQSLANAQLDRLLSRSFLFFLVMPSYKLYYFHARVVVETLRQLFALAGVEYENIVIPKEALPGEYKSKFPFGQLPVLEVDGQFIPQSLAIARYLAKQFGLAGKNDLDAAFVDAFVDQFKDYKDATKTEFGEEARAKFFIVLVARLKKSGSSGFLVGDSLTFIDLLIAEHVATRHERLPNFFDAYPELLAHSEKVRSIPAINAWIERRLKSEL